MSISRSLAIAKPTHGTVARIPSSIALADLLERITERGVELDAGSRLTALEDPDESRLLASANRPILVAGMNGVGRGRRGAPLSNRER